MATISNPQVVAFSNQQFRPTCDRIESAIRTMRQCVANYAAQGVGAQVAGTQTLQQSTIDDGSIADGRPLYLGYDMDNGINQMKALLAWIDSQAGLEAALAKAAVNDQPAF